MNTFRCRGETKLSILSHSRIKRIPVGRTDGRDADDGGSSLAMAETVIDTAGLADADGETRGSDANRPTA